MRHAAAAQNGSLVAFGKSIKGSRALDRSRFLATCSARSSYGISWPLLAALQKGDRNSRQRGQDTALSFRTASSGETPSRSGNPDTPIPRHTNTGQTGPATRPWEYLFPNRDDVTGG